MTHAQKKTQRGTALYNENDAYAAQWLRNLIARGLIAPGTVDTRSIRELGAADVAGPGQRHFFAGIGVWSHALRLARVPDECEVWTGSCPCQPFSDAGKRSGTSDPRHLWPTWFSLIQERRPPVIFGEQVASQDGLGWLDAVYADLERCDYAVGATDLCAAGIGAPHIRQRLWFVALANDDQRGRQILRATRLHDHWKPGHDTSGRRSTGAVAYGASPGRQPRRRSGEEGDGGGPPRIEPGRLRLVGDPGAVGDAIGDGLQAHVTAGPAQGPAGRSGRMADPDEGERGSLVEPARSTGGQDAQSGGGPGGLGDAGLDGAGEHARELPGDEGEHEERGQDGDHASVAASATRGFWARDVVWLPCIDGVSRPAKSGIAVLAHGTAGSVVIRRPRWEVEEVTEGKDPYEIIEHTYNRTGALRGFGNAIVGELGCEFIEAAIDVACEEEG